MKAVCYEAFGPPEVLRVLEVPPPVARAGQVLVEVHAAGVHPVEMAIRQGKLRKIVPGRFPRGVGGDFSGRVAAVGEGVSRVAVDELVYGVMPHMKLGSVAEFVAVPQEKVARIPDSISAIEAATLPVAGTTAQRALTHSVTLGPGQRLLVRGATGAVGVVAVQLGKALGAHVTALANARHGDLATSLGADVVLDYKKTPLRTLKQFDVILDLVGTQVSDLRRQLSPKGRLVTLALDPDHLLRSFLGVLAPRTRAFTNNPSAADLEALTRYVEQKQIRPVVSEVLAMHEVVRAHGLVERGGIRGRLILDLGKA
ncbi:oxidoreductase [Kineosporia sp. NBRC 101677]|uniref:NAD(P)-dependent alcohol dehydrogenase n=1 Tax=Kineosporia sp. NBRC 101677 TaxID=3032197 RepID=UPI0024A2376A|nr:NAD(P)-dependent alcohol dehydrogenase [Kineosporia sp. NBRC 101677]GLY17186.1 oxidoreductase [Kineosporia sp. NBRC 101677]